MRHLRAILPAFFALVLFPTLAHAVYTTASVTYSYEHPTSLSTVSDCDDCDQVVTLPFAYPYWGESFNEITIGSNGFIRLGKAVGAANYPFNKELNRFAGDSDISPSIPQNMIAPLWDDWNPQKGGDVYYGTAASGAFIVEWSEVLHNLDTQLGKYSFELKLWPSGQLEFHYVQLCGSGSAVFCNRAFDHGYSAHAGYSYRYQTLATLTHWPSDDTARSLHPLYNGQAFGWKPRPPTDPYYYNVYYKAADQYVDRPVTYLKVRFKWDCSNGSTTQAMSYDGMTYPGGLRSFSLYCAQVGYLPVLSSATVEQTSVWSQINTTVDPLPFYVPPALGPLNRKNGDKDLVSLSTVTAPNSVETVTPSTTDRFLRVLTWPKPERKVEFYEYEPYSVVENGTLVEDHLGGCTDVPDTTYVLPAWMDSTCGAGTNILASEYSKKQLHYPYAFYGQCAASTKKCQWPSFRDWYRGSSSKKDKVVLVVPGIDALNGDVSVEYYRILNQTGLLGRLLNEGWNVVIADYGDGAKDLRSLGKEVARWIELASAETDIDPVTGKPHKIHVLGVSQGGVLIRYALANLFSRELRQERVAAWYTADSPHKGASLGSGRKGLGTLLKCHKGATNAQRMTINSRPSKQMLLATCVNAHCDTDYINEAELDWCDSSDKLENPGEAEFGSLQQQFYSVLAPVPTDVPHYALVFGDYSGAFGLPTAFRGREGILPRGKMYDFTYSGWWSSAEQQWYSNARDCLAGSSYLSKDVVNSSDSDWGISGSLSLMYKPAFIPVHSAIDTGVLENDLIGGTYDERRVRCHPGASYDCFDVFGRVNGFCDPSDGINRCFYPDGLSTAPSACYTSAVGYQQSVPPGAHWTAWAANMGNWPHCVVSPYLSEKLYNWMTGSTAETESRAMTKEVRDISCFSP